MGRCPHCGSIKCLCISYKAGYEAWLNNIKPFPYEFYSYHFAAGFYGDDQPLKYSAGGYHPETRECDKCGKTILRLEICKNCYS